MPDATTARARQKPIAIVPVHIPRGPARPDSVLALLQERERVLALVKRQPGITRAQIMAELAIDGRRYRQHIDALTTTARVHIRGGRGRQTHVHPGRDRRRANRPAGPMTVGTFQP